MLQSYSALSLLNIFHIVQDTSEGCDSLKHIFIFSKTIAIEEVKLNQVVALYFTGSPPKLNEGRKEEILIRPYKF